MEELPGDDAREALPRVGAIADTARLLFAREGVCARMQDQEAGPLGALPLAIAIMPLAAPAPMSRP